MPVQYIVPPEPKTVLLVLEFVGALPSPTEYEIVDNGVRPEIYFVIHPAPNPD